MGCRVIGRGSIRVAARRGLGDRGFCMLRIFSVYNHSTTFLAFKVHSGRSQDFERVGNLGYYQIHLRLVINGANVEYFGSQRRGGGIPKCLRNTRLATAG